MNNVMRKRFHSKIGVIAGNRSHDYKGANVIRSAKRINPDAQFFGLAGEKMLAADTAFKNYADIDKLIDKPFHPHFNFDLDRRSPLYAPLFYSKIKSALALRELSHNNFYSNFEYGGAKDVDMVVTLGNELFALRLFEKITKICELESETKPLTIHVDALKRNFRWEHTSMLDFCVHTLPVPSADKEMFAFPSQFIGKQVIFDALSFIYRQHPKFTDYVSASMLNICPELNVLVVEELAFQMRKDFREKHFIPDSCYLFFVSPGSEESEIRANIKVAANGIDVFMKKFSQDNRFTKKNFGIVLSLPEGRGDLKALAAEFDSLEVFTHTVIGNEAGERYMAMAASDLAAVANGDSVFESSVFQLPTVIMDDSSFLSAYLKLMYNVYGSEFNWNAAGEVLPETLGRNFGAKVSEFWENWFISPKSRFKLARRTNKLMLELLPQETKGTKANVEIFDETKDFKSYMNPNLVFETFLEDVYLGFKEIKEKTPSRFEKAQRRKVLVLGPEFA